MDNQYMIIIENSPEKLAREVQSRMGEGWMPQGGVSVSNGSRVTYVQAMIFKPE
jgi:hypothetical protein